MGNTRCATAAGFSEVAGLQRWRGISAAESLTGHSLVQNFESQNPANTLWSKQYNLYSKIDTEGPRYLGFEQWWGGHINLNAEEIQIHRR